MRATRIGMLGVLILALAACSPKAETSPAKVRLFVTNEGSGDLSVIDAATRRELARIPLGKRPRGLAASHDGRILYIALSGSPAAGPGVDEASLPPPDRAADGIAVFDIGASRVVRVLRGISDPEQVAVSPDGRRIYVASEDSGRLFVIDASTGGIVATLDVGGEPEGVAVSPDGRLVLATSEEAGEAAIVETNPPRVRTRLRVGARPRNAVFSGDGRRAFVPGENDASVTAIDVAAGQIAGQVHLAQADSRPMGVVLSPDQRHLFVTTGRGGRLVRLDPATLRETGSVMVGERPWGVVIGPDGRFAYTANGPSNDVAIIDASALRVVARVRVGDRPWGAAIVQLR